MTTELSGEATSHDMEGIPDTLETPRKQKKIAVLTSGGDSAGMNAAGG